MPEDDKPPGFSDFDARLAATRQARQGDAKEAGEAEWPRLDWGRGMQAGIEIVVGVAVGCLLGWALDAWLGTGPFLLIGGFMLGAAAGMLNAFRSMRRLVDGDGDGSASKR